MLKICRIVRESYSFLLLLRLQKIDENHITIQFHVSNPQPLLVLVWWCNFTTPATSKQAKNSINHKPIECYKISQVPFPYHPSATFIFPCHSCVCNIEGSRISNFNTILAIERSIHWCDQNIWPKMCTYKRLRVSREQPSPMLIQNALISSLCDW